MLFVILHQSLNKERNLYALEIRGPSETDNFFWIPAFIVVIFVY